MTPEEYIERREELSSLLETATEQLEIAGDVVRFLNPERGGSLAIKAQTGASRLYRTATLPACAVPELLSDIILEQFRRLKNERERALAEHDRQFRSQPPE